MSAIHYGDDGPLHGGGHHGIEGLVAGDVADGGAVVVQVAAELQQAGVGVHVHVELVWQVLLLKWHIEMVGEFVDRYSI